MATIDIFAQISKEYRRDNNTVVEEVYEDGTLIEINERPDLLMTDEGRDKPELLLEQDMKNWDKSLKEHELQQQQSSCGGQKEGEHKYYDDNGKIKILINCLNGEKHGIQKTYNPLNGNLSKEEHYDNGKKDGVQKDYYLNGNLQMESSYQSNQLNGLIMRFFENGKIESEIMYLNGERNGDYKIYSENGDLLWKTQFNNGEQSDLIQTYYPLSPEKDGADLLQVPYRLLFWKNEQATISNCVFDECENASNMIFNDSSEYNQTLMTFVRTDWYPDFIFPEIDFDKYTVLGNYTSGSCASYFERYVVRIDNKKAYKYIVVVKHPNCPSGPPRTSLNLIAVPKIPDGYTVEFEIQDPGTGGKVELLGM